MYRSFYSLSKKPFHITPDPEFLFFSPSHREAFAAIIYGIEQRKGFLAITGEVGVGKTTILRAYLEKTEHDQHRMIYVFNAAVSFSGLLRLILGEFGVVVAEDDPFAMVNRLHLLLIEEYKNNRNVVLIIDEAQNMPVETLENLRMLSNLETSEDKLLQIVLVGQPELERLLNLHELRQLRQRIAVRCRINPLTEAESLAYIQHRLAKASAHGEVIFAPGALQPIIKEAGGIPRIINILCDNALLTGLGYQQRPISKKIVKEVVSEHRGSKRTPRRRWWLAPFAVAAVLMVVLFAGFPLPFPYSNTLSNLTDWGNITSRFLPPAPTTPPAPIEARTQPVKPAASTPPAEHQKSRENAAEKEEQPLSTTVSPDKRQEPLSTVSPAGATQPAPAEASRDEQTLVPAPVQAPPIAWVDHRALPLTPDPLPLTPHPSPLTTTVKEGDCITRLVIAVYGYADSKLIKTVKDYNPHIKDINLIRAGDLVAFPAIDRMKGQSH